MGVIDTFKYIDAFGSEETVEVRDYGDSGPYTYEDLRMHTPNGTGYIPTTETQYLDGSDSRFRVSGPKGIVAVNNSNYAIDNYNDFEDQSLGNFDSSNTDVTQAAALRDVYGMETTGTVYRETFTPEFEVEFLHVVPSGTTQHVWFTRNPDAYFRYETGDDRFYVSYEGTSTTKSTSFDSGQTLRFVFDIDTDQVRMRVTEESTLSYQEITLSVSTNYGGATDLEFDAGTTCYVDNFRMQSI